MVEAAEVTFDVLRNSSGKAAKHVHVTPDSPLFGYYLLTIVGIVLLGGIFSGLTLGLMGLDHVNLEVIALSGTDEQRRQAPKVLRLLRSGRHIILVVLLLGNTVVNASLPIFLDSVIGGGWIAVMGSTFLIVIFGEIIPQSVCGRFGLSIGATFAPVVKALVYIMYPIAWPIGKALDYFLGTHEGSTYRKAELKTFVTFGVADKLEEEEISLLGSMLEFAEKTVEDVMTPKSCMFTVSAEKIVDQELISEILHSGHSRIPIYEPSSPGAYIGFMTVRALVGYDPSDLFPASKFITQALPQCPPDLSLIEAMKYFQTGRSHMLLVSRTPGKDSGVLGVVTLEDVVEELIGKEIVDETDLYLDIKSRIPVLRPKASTSGPGLKRIYEGELARRRVILARKGETPTGTLVDHPSNLV